MKIRFLSVGAAILFIFFAACGQGRERETPPLPVTVMVAAPDVISRIVMAPCRIEAAREAVVTVSSPVRIEEVLVAEGDSVLQGEVLVRLATDDMYRSSVNSAASLISAALSAAEYSESNLARAENLFRSGAISPLEYEAAVSVAESARAALSQARAGYQQATAAGSSGQVTAPFDGRVTRVWAKTGNRAAGPLIAISGDGVLRAELLLSERHLPWIREGLPAFFTTAHFTGEIFPGSVVSASGSVDPLSGLVPVTVQFPDASDRLVPGISGMVTISLETVENAIVLPGQALRPTGNGTWEAVLIREGIALIERVETGIRQGNSWEITSGIEPGDSVIVLGNHLVDEGTAVEVVNR